MADIDIDNSIFIAFNESVQPRSLVWINSGTGYVFYPDSDQSFVCKKTINGGSTWSAPVNIDSNNLEKFGIWYDGWTRGITGSNIHVCFLETVSDQIIYRTLNIGTDTFGDNQIVFDGASASTTESWGDHCLSITKARGGNLYVGGWIDNSGEKGFWRSTDGGSTWSARSDVTSGNNVAEIQLLPASGTDGNDIWCIYDKSSQAEGIGSVFLRVYDDSANSWDWNLIVNNGTDVETTSFFHFDSTTRNSDDHGLLVLNNRNTSIAGSYNFYDIVGAGSIVEKTPVVTAESDLLPHVGIMINQQNDYIFVTYFSGTPLSMGSIIYKESRDDGDSWIGPGLVSETADDHRLIMGGTSIGNDGGRFQPAWFNDDLNDLLTNKLTSSVFGVSGGGGDITQYITFNYSDSFNSIINIM